MIFEKYLIPDCMVNTYRDITTDYLLSHGIKLLICDIDNTLVTYEDIFPTECLIDWFSSMNEAGIMIAFVSNNHAARVEQFNSGLGFIAFADAHKPFTGKIKEAMKIAGVNAENAALLGDQLLTDAAGAKLSGLHCIIVPPIKDKKTFFFRFKRMLEGPYVRKYKKLHITY